MDTQSSLVWFALAYKIMTHTGAYQEMLNSNEKITCFRLWYEFDLSWYAYRMNLTSSSMREGRIWNVPDFHMNLTSPDTGMRPVRIWSLFQTLVWIWPLLVCVSYESELSRPSYKFDLSWYAFHMNLIRPVYARVEYSRLSSLVWILPLLACVSY